MWFFFQKHNRFFLNREFFIPFFFSNKLDPFGSLIIVNLIGDIDFLQKLLHSYRKYAWLKHRFLIIIESHMSFLIKHIKGSEWIIKACEGRKCDRSDSFLVKLFDSLRKEPIRQHPFLYRLVYVLFCNTVIGQLVIFVHIIENVAHLHILCNI